MTYRGHLSRAEIGLRPPDSRSTNIDASRGGVTGHYAGKAQGVSTSLSGHSKCLSLWRGYQNYHMDRHGWADIAYSLGVCQHGYLLAGRGANVRTAANGTSSGNSYWYAICWIGGGSEKPTQDAIDAFWVAVGMLQRDGGAANRTNDHSDHKATACAGDPMRAVIDAGPTQGDDMNEPQEKMLREVHEAMIGRGMISPGGKGPFPDPASVRGALVGERSGLFAILSTDREVLNLLKKVRATQLAQGRDLDSLLDRPVAEVDEGDIDALVAALNEQLPSAVVDAIKQRL